MYAFKGKFRPHFAAAVGLRAGYEAAATFGRRQPSGRRWRRAARLSAFKPKLNKIVSEVTYV